MDNLFMNETWQNLLIISDNPVIKVLLVILVAILAQQFLKASLKGVLVLQSKNNSFSGNSKDRQKRLRTLNGIAGATASLMVWLVAILTILGILHAPIAPLLTGAGLIGAAIAFGMQSLIKDFISGIFIIAENQYRVDDYVQLDKIAGQVESITVRTTVIRDDDGSLHHIPNGTVGVTTNLSMGRLKAREQLEINASMSISAFESKLLKIANNIKADSELESYVKEGPWLVGVNKATAKSTTITIAFATSASKRTRAANIVWQQIIKEKIPLA